LDDCKPVAEAARNGLFINAIKGIGECSIAARSHPTGSDADPVHKSNRCHGLQCLPDHGTACAFQEFSSQLRFKRAVAAVLRDQCRQRAAARKRSM
jgi:hypothetical protein